MTSEEAREKSLLRIKKWEEHPELKEQMRNKCSKNNTIYKIHQYDKITKEFIKTWGSVKEIIDANPTYKKHNIYAVCSGEKNLCMVIYGKKN